MSGAPFVTFEPDFGFVYVFRDACGKKVILCSGDEDGATGLVDKLNGAVDAAFRDAWRRACEACAESVKHEISGDDRETKMLNTCMRERAARCRALAANYQEPTA